MRYVALLRGINVGGRNLISMTKLKACLEAQGFDEVTTYIQSGNVLFTAPASDRVALTRQIEELLTEAYRYDVIFLKEPLTAKTAIKSVLTKEGVDEAHPGVGVLYFSRLISKASQSRLSKIVTTPIYRTLTIRNWNTTTKLLKMM